MRIERVYVTCSGPGAHFTRCCVASIRRWHPEVPILLVKDESERPFDTSELERAWDVGVFRPAGGQFPRSWAKIGPLLEPDGRRCLSIDNDIVFLGPVIDRLEALDADFVVEARGGEPEPLSLRPDWMRLDYFDLEALAELDPDFEFPGFTFNAGQLVATSGILARSDFEPFVRFEPDPRKIHPEIFGGIDQGILNYVLMKKAQLGELTLAREPFMEWGFAKLPRSYRGALRSAAPAADTLVHWAGKKHPVFFLTPNAWLLRHFEALYYTHVPGGARKRALRSLLGVWRLVRFSVRKRWLRLRGRG